MHLEDQNLKRALDFAIQREQAAADLYHLLAEKSTQPAAKQLFQELEQIELGHKHSLENFTFEKYTTRPEPMQDLKLTDYLVEVDLNQDTFTVQEGILLAAKSEEKARQLYLDLASRFRDDSQLSQFFNLLAEEEGRHKSQLEAYYDDEVFREN